MDIDLIHAAETKAIDYLLGWRSAIPIYEAVFAFDMAEAVSHTQARTLILDLGPPKETATLSAGQAPCGPSSSMPKQKPFRLRTAPLWSTSEMRSNKSSLLSDRNRWSMTVAFSTALSTEPTRNGSLRGPRMNGSKLNQTAVLALTNNVAGANASIPDDPGFAVEQIVAGSGFHTVSILRITSLF